MPLLLACKISLLSGASCDGFCCGVSMGGGSVFVPEGSSIKTQTTSLIQVCTGWATVLESMKTAGTGASYFLRWWTLACTGSNESGLKNSTAKNKQKNIKNKTERKQQKKEKKWHTKKRKQEKLHCSSDRIRYTDYTWEASVLKELVLNHNWNHSWPTTSSLPWMSFQSQALMTREHPWEME